MSNGGFSFVSEGRIGAIEYVTVLDAGGNPQEYNLPREEAEARYGPTAKIRVTDVAGTGGEFTTERSNVASALRAEWFWDAPEESRDQVFAWLDELQRQLNQRGHTKDLESALGIEIDSVDERESTDSPEHPTGS
jgi:hypothetical protein